jgi:hypothetical protein
MHVAYGDRVTASRSLRTASIAVLVLLLIQFVIGMAVNLFVQIPRNHPGARPPEYFSGAAQSVAWAVSAGPFWLLVHAGLGLVLVAAGAVLLAMAIAARRRGPIIGAVIGLLAVVGAGFNGASFLNYDEDFSSMLMSAAFAVAVAAYAIGPLMDRRDG